MSGIARLLHRLGLLLLGLLSLGAGSLSAQSTREEAVLAAAKSAAAAVVTIETTGGSEMVAMDRNPRGQNNLLRKGTGPTTGVVIHPDGWIVSSAFNFANKPTSIIVSIGTARHIATLVATDTTRMISLLKVPSATPLVARAAPPAELQVGQTVVALGRTLSPGDALPSISVGIVSALARIQGKAIQTDAKVSPVNYGGPLIDLRGRVTGILVPLSPQAEGEGAGIEWYDSGIGFAIPIEQILGNLPRLMQGKDLQKGMIGILLKQGMDPLSDEPEIGTVQAGSPAAKASMQAGDKIIAVGPVGVKSTAQFQTAMAKYYSGDTVELELQRGETKIKAKIELASPSRGQNRARLGLFPMRDDAGKGILIRQLEPDGPAEKAGLKPGDRILAARPVFPGQPRGPAAPPLKAAPKFDRKELIQNLDGLLAGMEIELLVQKKGATSISPLKVKTGLGSLTLANLQPENASARAENEEKASDKKPQTGVVRGTNAAQDRSWKALVPRNAGKESHGLLVWLHPPGRNKDRDFEEIINLWELFCTRNRLVLLMPVCEADAGWTVADDPFILEAVRTFQDSCNIDNNRIVAHGFAQGGQMASHLGSHSKGLFKAVATVGTLPSPLPKEAPPNGLPAFFLCTGDRDPQAEALRQTQKTLSDLGLPAYLHLMPQSGQQYLELGALETMLRWIEGLDGI